MAKTPVPVLMVSSLTAEGAKVTLDALDIGAVDFIPKNLSELSLNIVKIKNVLIEKIKHIGRRGIVLQKKQSLRPLEMPKTIMHVHGMRIGVVVIGASTGGPKALQNVVCKLPKDFSVPVLIAQHMPPNFTGPFAERLNQLSALEVKEAENGEPVKKGMVFIAPGKGHMSLSRKSVTEISIAISENRGDYIYRPSVDALMLSVVENFSGRTLGVILTGMGNDGEKGMKAIKDAGGKTIAESEETCVVYGMPKAVVDAGLADKVVPIDEIAGEIINIV